MLPGPGPDEQGWLPRLGRSRLQRLGLGLAVAARADRRGGP
jgi:hypothetical protein